MKPPVPDAPYVPRPEIEKRIADAFEIRARLLLLGRFGSGRRTLLTRALGATAETRVVDVRQIQRARDVDAVFARALGGNDIRGALKDLDARARAAPIALVLANIDWVSGSADEDSIIGDLRGELQRVTSVGVFYTAADPDFVAKHFHSNSGAFSRQALTIPVPNLPLRAVDDFCIAALGCLPQPTAAAAIARYVGLRACDLSLFYSILGGRGKRKTLTRAEVLGAVRQILDTRAAVYARMISRDLTPRQRSVLMAVADGVSFRATRQMEAATGVPVSALSSVLRELRTRNWIVDLGSGATFDDPLLGAYLQASRNGELA